MPPVMCVLAQVLICAEGELALECCNKSHFSGRGDSLRRGTECAYQAYRIVDELR